MRIESGSATNRGHSAQGKIWIASYPRSGNTFLRCILYNCFGLPSTSVYPRDLGNNRALERYAGHFDADASHSELTADKPLLVKTHKAPTDDARAIYIVRDGRAASVSLWEFQRGRSPLRSIIANRVWSDHVAAWRPWARPRTMLLRYEEMIDDLSGVLRRLSEFLDRPIRSSEPPSRSDVAGVAGRWVREPSDWLAKISRRDLQLFTALNGQMMSRLGYQEHEPDAVAELRAAGPVHRIRLKTGKVVAGVDARCSVRYWRLRAKLQRWRARLRKAASANLRRLRERRRP